MKFTEHRDSNINTVKKYSPGSVQVNQFTLTTSCFITQKDINDSWQCAHISKLSTALLDELLTTDAEVIILGTGEKQIFPEPRLFAYCASQGVGLEVMANDAACRTYNVLTTEDRDVVLALIMG